MKNIKQIDEDLKIALKSKDEVRLRVLRTLKTALRNKEVELRKKELDEKEIFQVINSQVKQRHDSIEQFEKGNRKDLVDAETAELAVLQEYLPPSLSEEELVKVIKETIIEIGASSLKEMGQVMKAVMAKVAGRADGKEVSSLVAKLLQPKK